MSTIRIIRYRHWIYGAEQTMPQLDSPKGEAIREVDGSTPKGYKLASFQDASLAISLPWGRHKVATTPQPALIKTLRANCGTPQESLWRSKNGWEPA